MKKYLVLLDTDKIKGYIFSTNRLKLIRGASSILAELNEKGAVKNRVGLYNGEYIFAGGGQIMAEFNSAERAEEFISAEQAEYKKLDASITGIKEEYKDGFESVVQRAQIKLRRAKEERAYVTHLLGKCQYLTGGWKRAKEERAYVTHLLSNPFFKTCQLCGVKPASKLKYDNFVCTACERKMDRGEKIRKKPKESPIYAKFMEFVEKQHRDQEWKNAKFTEDLSELGKLSKPENYLGLICADGNRMGERLFKRKSKTEYQDLSNAIESGLQESVFESLLEYIPNPREGKIPFEFVIMGGDDLIMITPAEKAIPIALKTLEKFKDIAKERGAEKFTLSAGVVIAHAKYPISSFTQRGEDLLKSAKKLNKKKWYGAERESERRDIATIDYLVVSTPSANPVDTIREKDLVYTMGPTREYTYKLTQRPFTLEKACKIRDMVNEIKKSGLSRSRLYSLSDSLLNGKNQSILTILSLINRLKGEEKNIRHLFEKIRAETDFYQNDGLFPWNSSEGEIDTYDTPFLDILEIYDFIEEERE